MSIDERVTKLENLVNALIAKIDKKNFYQSADTASEVIGIKNNSMGVSENDTAICDVADLSDVNSQAIDDLAEMVDELSNKVAELEG